mmetsp:Transcript_4349/g.16391  ORF Transcript_4349/g.16391 Transcript_4349/m.16391 type:complete len:150 (-) Transcript_4349:286-735(-)
MDSSSPIQYRNKPVRVTGKHSGANHTKTKKSKHRQHLEAKQRRPNFNRNVSLASLASSLGVAGNHSKNKETVEDDELLKQALSFYAKHLVLALLLPPYNVYLIEQNYDQEDRVTLGIVTLVCLFLWLAGWMPGVLFAYGHFIYRTLWED